MMKHRKTGFELKHTKKEIIVIRVPIVSQEDNQPSLYDQIMHSLNDSDDLKNDYFFLIIEDITVETIQIQTLNHHNQVLPNKTQLRYLEAINKAIQKHDH